MRYDCGERKRAADMYMSAGGQRRLSESKMPLEDAMRAHKWVLRSTFLHFFVVPGDRERVGRIEHRQELRATQAGGWHEGLIGAAVSCRRCCRPAGRIPLGGASHPINANTNRRDELSEGCGFHLPSRRIYRGLLCMEAPAHENARPPERSADGQAVRPKGGHFSTVPVQAATAPDWLEDRPLVEVLGDLLLSDWTTRNAPVSTAAALTNRRCGPNTPAHQDCPREGAA